MKILVVRFSSIGDIILCTPVIRACKLQLGAEVHLLTKAGYSSLLSNNPYIGKILSFSSSLEEVKADLLSENYDYVIDLHKNIRSRIVKHWLKKPSGTFPKLNLLKWFLVRLKVNRLPDLHIVDRYFKAHPHLMNDGAGLDYIVRKENHIDLGIGPYYCLVLGATYYTKRIPEEVLRKILMRNDEQVVLIGGPEEGELGSELEAEFSHVLNACGKYTIDQSASIIEGSRLVVASDTGMMHIAAALKKRIVMVWGNTVPEFGMGPYETAVTHMEVEGLSCRPCSKLGSASCPKGHFKCMKAQDLLALSEAIAGD